MKISYPFENYDHVPLIYRREFPAGQMKEWFLDSIRKNREERKTYSHREILVQVLKNQYGKISCKPLEELIKDDTYTVTTGHQLSIFGGPLFFLYKILSTIRLAKDLNKNGAVGKVIPVFWMATEDHDYEEIKSINLFGKKISWETEQGGAVGRYSVEGINKLVDELDEQKGNLPHAAELQNIFKSAYSGNRTLADATRIFLHELFSEFGLVIIDGDDPQLKKLFCSQIQKEITEQPVVNIVNRTNEKLTREGFHPQVHPREINLFYLGANSRKRIVQIDTETFGVFEDEKKWSRNELLEEVELNPEKFSPNVLMRPLYQETILPNLAYIGGPGEIAYWKQLDDVFIHFGIKYPVLIPRHSIMLLEPGVSSKMEKLGLDEKEIFQQVDELIRKFIDSIAGEEIELSGFKDDLKNLFEHLSERAGNVDPTLKPGVLAEQQKEIKFIDSLEARLRKAEKNKNETSVNQIRHIKEKLFPEGIPQERHDSFVYFYWKYGKEGIAFLLENMVSFDLRYMVARVE